LVVFYLDFSWIFVGVSDGLVGGCWMGVGCFDIGLQCDDVGSSPILSLIGSENELLTNLLSQKSIRVKLSG
jgi:hypothetical protein